MIKKLFFLQKKSCFFSKKCYIIGLLLQIMEEIDCKRVALYSGFEFKFAGKWRRPGGLAKYLNS